MLPVPVRDWSDAFVASSTPALGLFLTGIARAIAFLIIVVVGWLLASLLAKATQALLRKVRFNELADRSGFTQLIRNAGAEKDAADFVGLLAKWFIRLAALVVAFDVMGLPAVSDVVRQFLLWLPNLVVAVAILIIGGLVANAFAGVVRGAAASAEIGNPHLMANIARVVVWAITIIAAVNQVGIARELVNALFIATIGAVALAAGLAFGLGEREAAADILRDLLSRSRRAAAMSSRRDEVADRTH